MMIKVFSTPSMNIFKNTLRQTTLFWGKREVFPIFQTLSIVSCVIISWIIYCCRLLFVQCLAQQFLHFPSVCQRKRVRERERESEWQKENCMCTAIKYKIIFVMRVHCNNKCRCTCCSSYTHHFSSIFFFEHRNSPVKH